MGHFYAWDYDMVRDRFKIILFENDPFQNFAIDLVKNGPFEKSKMNGPILHRYVSPGTRVVSFTAILAHFDYTLVSGIHGNKPGGHHGGRPVGQFVGYL